MWFFSFPCSLIPAPNLMNSNQQLRRSFDASLPLPLSPNPPLGEPPPLYSDGILFGGDVPRGRGHVSRRSAFSTSLFVVDLRSRLHSEQRGLVTNLELSEPHYLGMDKTHAVAWVFFM